MEIKLFNKWACEGIKVQDPGLKNYISLSPVIVPRTSARYAGFRFHKSNANIVERLINKIMVPGHRGKKHTISSGSKSGKGHKASQLVESAFDLIEQKTKKNPVEVYVKAVENAAPREEIVTIEYGGARYPKAVECAPQRRIDIALRLFVQGAYAKAFNKGKKGRRSAEYLADEIINASNMSNSSNAISKKIELERQADASR